MNCFNLLSQIPCFLIGNGPSLNNQNLKLIQDYFSIGINRAFQITTPTITIWQDRSFWRTERRGLSNSKTLKYCANIHPDALKKHGVYGFKLYKGDFQHTTDTRILYGTGATGPIAFQLAVAMGCNPIILLGMDCLYDGKKTNFYGTNRFHAGTMLEYCHNGLEWMYENTRDRHIINCSLNKLWKNTIIEDAVKQIDDHWALGIDLYQKLLTEQLR